MAVKEDIAFFQRRQVLGVPGVAVGHEDHMSFQIEDHVIGEDGEVQYHLIHFGLAVAADAEELFFHVVEHADNGFGVVFGRQIVAGAVIKQVAQKNQLFGFFRFIAFFHFFCVLQGTVEIGCDHQFHRMLPHFF